MSSRAMRRLREEMGGGSDLPPAPQEEEGEEAVVKADAASEEDLRKSIRQEVGGIIDNHGGCSRASQATLRVRVL